MRRPRSAEMAIRRVERRRDPGQSHGERRSARVRRFHTAVIRSTRIGTAHQYSLHIRSAIYGVRFT